MLSVVAFSAEKPAGCLVWREVSVFEFDQGKTVRVVNYQTCGLPL